MAAAIKALMSMGVAGVMDALTPAFEQASGQKLEAIYNTSAALTKLLEVGAAADVVVGTRAMVDALIASGRVARGSDVDLASSVVGIAVRKGAGKPDISTTEAFLRALHAARAIACSDPAGGGASGVHFVKLIGQLGIADQITPKLRLAPVGRFSAEYLVSGEVEIAVQQISELMVVADAEIVGPLPDDIQQTTTFTGGIHAQASAPQAARALLDFLRTSEAAAVIRAKGLVPA
jgi:molybdate transport system substrate-binding protein